MESKNPALRTKALRAGSQELADYGVMTMPGAINKSGLLFLILAVSGAVGWNLESGVLMTVGLILGMITAFILFFNPRFAPALAPVYAIFEGLALGTFSVMMEARYPGIAGNAMILTFGTLGVMLLTYKMGLLRATPRFMRVMSYAMLAILLTYIVDMVMGFFGMPIAMIHQGSPVGILFSVVVVGVAALNLIIDFEFFERNAEYSPKFMEWYCGFSLLVTMVWLYMEILRLLSKLNRR